MSHEQIRADMLRRTPGDRAATLLLALFACMAFSLSAFAAAAPAGSGTPAGPRDPIVQPQPDNSFVIESRGYRAVVGADGNLHSLRVGDAEMIDDRVAISLGAFFYADGPRKLSTISFLGPTSLQATDNTYTVQYQFLRSEVRIYLINSGKNPTPYYVVLSPEITIVSNMQTNEAAAAPSTEAWGDVRVSTPKGAYLQMVGGSRIWGPWLGRQVWEVSRVVPGQHVQIRILAGQGDPPKATLEQLVGVQVKVEAPDGIVHVDNPVMLRVAIENRSETPISGLVSMELAASRTDQVIYATEPAQLPAKSTVNAEFRATVEAPDFYLARVTVSAEGRDLASARAATGYRVAEIAPTANRPADFREFWQRLLTEVGDQPPDYTLDISEERSLDKVSVWVARYRGIGSKTIHGWYIYPDAPGPRPAILFLSGYGARPIVPPVGLAKQGYVVLAIDVRGNPVDKPRPRPFEDYGTKGIESPDTYVYREIVGHALRGLRFLASRQEVDPKRIAVVGVSDGGGAGLILGALTPEVRAVAADAPMLCDFGLSLRQAAWPYTEIVRYAERGPEQTAQVDKTLPYFDVVNFAPDIKCPVLLSAGFLDPVSLPSAVYGAYNLITGPKEIVPLPEAGHEGGGRELWAYKLEWLARTLGPPQGQ